MDVYIINTDATSFVDLQNCHPEKWVTEQLAFSGGERKYGDALGRITPGDCCSMYHNGKGVIGVGHCTARWDELSYADSKYYETTLVDPPEYRLGVDWGDSLLPTPLTLAELRDLCRYDARWAPSKSVFRVASPSTSLLAWLEVALASTRFARCHDELGAADVLARKYWEGAIARVEVNAYERSSAARAACVAKWGTLCQACGVDFDQRYGELGRGFIHVHHLTPVSANGRAYQLDPVNDLRPLCPNCHAMVHRKYPPLSIEELRLLLQPSQ